MTPRTISNRRASPGWTQPDYITEPLYVLTPLYNPKRYKARWKRYEQFAKHITDAGAVLITVEVSFGERHLAETHFAPHRIVHSAADRSGWDAEHRYWTFQTAYELWLKENAINLGLSRLPADAKYIAWIDGDVSFARPNIVSETIHQLQHFAFVQMFSEAVDLDPDYRPLQRHLGFVHCYLRGMKRRAFDDQPYYGQPAAKGGINTWHPGFAWAARREALSTVGGLLDHAILGAGDNHMANALIGDVERSMHPRVHPEYRRRCLEWQYRCETHIRRNVGCVDGLLMHHWHGKKRDRRYADRWQILVDHQYNPDTDLKPDWQGLHQLVDRQDARSIALRDAIRTYFAQRNEDSIDI